MKSELYFKRMKDGAQVTTSDLTWGKVQAFV
jgi:hypothetical protein